jgi:hypothetical protein
MLTRRKASRPGAPPRRARHRAALARRTDPEGRDLATLYRLFQGPIATTLDNKREPFVAVADAPPGKNVYPWDLTKAELDAFLAAIPIRADRAHRHALGGPPRRRAVAQARPRQAARNIRRSTRSIPAFARGSSGWPKRPTGDALRRALFVAYADEMIRAHGLLNEAADAVEAERWEFARYLRNRARDLLSDDYESGDAAWITGRFKNLNAQIGAYETYDDELLGTRAFYGSACSPPAEEGAALRKAMQGCRRSRTLPYDRHKKVREDIPVGVYDVIADFGQARGGNTATILPNEAYLAKRYGSIILLRANIMRDPKIFGAGGAAWARGGRARNSPRPHRRRQFLPHLWHEVGHYLGVDRTATAATSTSRSGRRQPARGDEGRPGLAVRRPGAAPPRLLHRRPASLASMPAASCARCRTSGRAASSPTT